MFHELQRVRTTGGFHKTFVGFVMGHILWLQFRVFNPETATVEWVWRWHLEPYPYQSDKKKEN